MITSVAEVLAETATQRPCHTAVIFGHDRVTYGWIWDRARRCAAVLRANGVQPGDRVVLLLADTPQFPVVYFAVLAAGAVVVPLTPASTAAEVAHVLADADARFLVSTDSFLDRVGVAATRDTVLFTIGDGRADAVNLTTTADETVPIAACETTEPDDIAVVFYTSGTTGQPKGVMLTHRNIVGNVETMVSVPYAFGDDDVLLGCLPLAHGFGQLCGLLTSFRAGIPLVLMERFAAREALALMRQHECTVFMGVPTMYVRMLEALAQGHPAPRLDRVYSGGAPLSPTTLDEVRDAFGCPVFEGYGMTETSCSVAYHHPGLPFRSGTTGVAISNDITLGICRPEANGIELLAAGDVGEIVVGGPTVMAGYLGRPDLTADVLTDGFFRTGDLGRLDEDGYLSVVGRKKELILRGGHNVYPREIEEIMLAHPAVAGVAVIGLPHSELGEEVCAVVVPVRGQDATTGLDDQLIAWSRERLAAYKCPRRIEFVDALPLGPGGKVVKRQLVSTYASPGPRAFADAAKSE